jgi:hypothetical protein
MAKFWATKNLQIVQGAGVRQTVTGSNANNQYLGDTLITSRNTFVGAPVVTATSPIFIQPHWLGPASYAIGVNFQISSVQPGSGFYISTINSVGFGAASAASVACWWEVKLR